MDSDSYDEMYRLPSRDSSFSEDMADRLLAGQVPVSEAPPAYRGLAALLESAASGPIAEETAHKASVVYAALAAFEAAGSVHAPSHASTTPTSRRRSMLSKLLTAKAAAVATAAALGLGTAAAAATGSLPMQHANSHADVGLAIAASSQSGTNGNSNGHGKNSNAGNSTGAASNKHAQFGLCTAFMAHHPTSTTPASSVPSDKSKTFSALISNHGGLAGTSTYCQGVIAQHSATTDTGDASTGPDDNGGATPDTGNKPSNAGPPSSTPPVSTPNSGGTGTAGTASNGSSTGGATTAGGASGGASVSGSGNAGGH